MILIVGAGPSGLVMAHWLARLGVPFRLIDKATEPGTTSRALVVHARTLELYRQLGLAAGVVERGLRFDAINLWIRGKRAAHVEFGGIGQGVTSFPHMLIFPQDRHERFLIERLQEFGAKVERSTELAGFIDHGDRVAAEICHADGHVEQMMVDYIVGCDGARSQVREVLGTGFPGGTYDRMFYVADVELQGPLANHELHAALDDADFFAAFPLQGEGAARLIGTVRTSAIEAGRALAWEDVSSAVLERLQLKVDKVNWFSTYHVHHRVASSFRRGRAFLVGDAAHIHSPVGGQGMNTGIGDAVNLAWKLAAVVQQRADVALLDSYEPERIAFAQRLVSTTDRAFAFTTADGPIARVVRRQVMPRILPPLLKIDAMRRFMFRTISQTLINYRQSALNEGNAGPVRGGDRLPWVMPEADASGDNFTPLQSLDWQVHVYGVATNELSHACAKRALPLHQFDWREPMRAVGLRRNVAYLVRPDGYVGLANADSAGLGRYLDSRGILVRPA